MGRKRRTPPGPPPCREYEAARAQGAPDAEQTRTREKFKAADAKLSQFERDTGRRRRREREYAP